MHPHDSILLNWTDRIALIIAVVAAILVSILTVSHAAVVVDEAMVKEAVRAHVQKVAEERGFIQKGGTVHIEIPQVPRAPFAFPETESLDSIALEAGSTLHRFFSPQSLIRIKLVDAETGQIRQIGVPVKISMSMPVWEAKTMVMAGTAISPKDFRQTTREITQSFDRLLGSDTPITQYAARINVHPGDYLDTSNIIKPPAVRRNSAIKIVMAGPNGVKLAVEGKSLDDGQIGQTVRVRNRINKTKEYTGKVIAENQVQVNL